MRLEMGGRVVIGNDCSIWGLVINCLQYFYLFCVLKDLVQFQSCWCCNQNEWLDLNYFDIDLFGLVILCLVGQLLFNFNESFFMLKRGI